MIFFKDTTFLKHKPHLKKLKIHAFCVGPIKKTKTTSEPNPRKE